MTLDYQFTRTSFLCGCFLLFPSLVNAEETQPEQSLLARHCADCHSGSEPEGKFRIKTLGEGPDQQNFDLWTQSLERIKAGEMPSADSVDLSARERQELVQSLTQRINHYYATSSPSFRVTPRRLNNREFRNSVRDVLQIEDIGTHLPADNMIGDTLHHGFDTHGETLGFSKFHLEQTITSIRRILDATILTDPKPECRSVSIQPNKILSAHTSQNTKRRERRGRREGFDFLDPKELAYFEDFPSVPTTGWYRISIDCVGLDKDVYAPDKTGIYPGDPIQLSVEMGDRTRRFELTEDVQEIKLTEWLAAGTRLRLRYPTDGLTFRGNGNFKFQYAIGGEYIKEHEPELYEEVASSIVTRPGRRVLRPESWHHWVDHWRGPRPRILGASIEGPFFESWPPQRQVNLIGEIPSVDSVPEILRPIAERAWRREVSDGELTRIVELVKAKEGNLGTTGALKEGIVAILASPPFLLLNTEELSTQERFAAKLSYFLRSTIPDAKLIQSIKTGDLDDFDGIHHFLEQQLSSDECQPFLDAFPYAWLQLGDINFMAPDPDRYPFYHRERVSEDMIEEARAFFRHVVREDLSLIEFLSADYSFINKDLAELYGFADVPQDSTFRKYTFKDDTRGGLLGMASFLTSTADSLGTSPIHRAIYVMENFLGIHPSPPPAGVDIPEPDIRSARTIKEVLDAHRSDESCAACHRRIDPFGWAFENFDSVGAWRETYDGVPEEGNARKNKKKIAQSGVPVDASARFQNGDSYADIREFRQLMLTPINQHRFVRCFVSKLLTYANGSEPNNYVEIERIVAQSAQHKYRMTATLAAVIDSPLFRETEK